MRAMIRRLVRLSTLGLVGRSPRERYIDEQRKLAKARRKAVRRGGSPRPLP